MQRLEAKDKETQIKNGPTGSSLTQLGITDGPNQINLTVCAVAWPKCTTIEII